MIMSGNKTEKSVADHLLTADVDPLRSHLHIAVGETFFVDAYFFLLFGVHVFKLHLTNLLTAEYILNIMGVFSLHQAVVWRNCCWR